MDETMTYAETLDMPIRRAMNTQHTVSNGWESLYLTQKFQPQYVESH